MSHPENRYIQKIHRLLKPYKDKKELYYAKVQVSGNNGWPDCYYSGLEADLWAEYKWVSERDFPMRDATEIKVNLSTNQSTWLNGRHTEGRNVCVIVGSPHGAVILEYPFPKTIRRDHFMSSAVDSRRVIQYILAKILPSALQPCADQNNLSTEGTRHDYSNDHPAR